MAKPGDKSNKGKKKGTSSKAKGSSLKANLDALEKTLKNVAKPVYGAGREPGNLFGIIKGAMTKDSAKYSMANVFRAFSEKSWEYAKLEYSIHQQLLKEGYSPPNKGILVPSDPRAIENECPRMKGLKEQMQLEGDSIDPDNLRRLVHERRKDLAAFGSDLLGGALVMPVLDNSIIELLRPLVVTERAGAQVMQLPPSGQISIAKQTTDPTFSWLGENTEIAKSDPGFGNIILSSKKAAGRVVMSADSVRFTNPGLEMITRNQLARRGAIFEDQAYIQGTGSSFQPRGITEYAGIVTHTATVTGTHGDTFSFEDPQLMIGKILANNDPEGPTGWLLHPTLQAGLLNRRADAVTAADGKGVPLFWANAADMEKGTPGKLRGVPMFPTTSMATDRVKGSGTTLTRIILGNFRHAVIARSGVMELAMAQDGAYFDYDQIGLRAIFRVDFALLQEGVFAVCDYLLNA